MTDHVKRRLVFDDGTFCLDISSGKYFKTDNPDSKADYKYRTSLEKAWRWHSGDISRNIIEWCLVAEKQNNIKQAEEAIRQSHLSNWLEAIGDLNFIKQAKRASKLEEFMPWIKLLPIAGFVSEYFQTLKSVVSTYTWTAENNTITGFSTVGDSGWEACSQNEGCSYSYSEGYGRYTHRWHNENQGGDTDENFIRKVLISIISANTISLTHINRSISEKSGFYRHPHYEEYHDLVIAWSEYECDIPVFTIRDIGKFALELNSLVNNKENSIIREKHTLAPYTCHSGSLNELIKSSEFHNPSPIAIRLKPLVENEARDRTKREAKEAQEKAEREAQVAKLAKKEQERAAEEKVNQEKEKAKREKLEAELRAERNKAKKTINIILCCIAIALSVVLFVEKDLISSSLETVTYGSATTPPFSTTNLFNMNDGRGESLLTELFLLIPRLVWCFVKVILIIIIGIVWYFIGIVLFLLVLGTRALNDAYLLAFVPFLIWFIIAKTYLKEDIQPDFSGEAAKENAEKAAKEKTKQEFQDKKRIEEERLAREARINNGAKTGLEQKRSPIATGPQKATSISHEKNWDLIIIKIAVLILFIGSIIVIVYRAGLFDSLIINTEQIKAVPDTTGRIRNLAPSEKDEKMVAYEKRLADINRSKIQPLSPEQRAGQKLFYCAYGKGGACGARVTKEEAIRSACSSEGLGEIMVLKNNLWEPFVDFKCP